MSTRVCHRLDLLVLLLGALISALIAGPIHARCPLCPEEDSFPGRTAVVYFYAAFHEPMNV